MIGAPLEDAFEIACAQQTVLLEIAEGQFTVELTVGTQVVVGKEFDAQGVPRAIAYRVWNELLTLLFTPREVPTRDCACLALAEARGVTVLTAERAWAKLPDLPVTMQLIR